MIEFNSITKSGYEQLYSDVIEKQELIFRIEAHVLNFLRNLKLYKLYEFKVKTTKSNSKISRQLNVNILPYISSKVTLKKLQKLAYRLIILSEIYSWQNKNNDGASNEVFSSMTLRQIYYTTTPTGNTLLNGTRTLNQRASNEEILIIGNLLRASRSDLGISEVSKGQYFYNSNSINNITHDMINNIDLEKLKQIQPRCIIVVEKEGIFLTMYKHKFTKLIPSIIVCAKGFPDLNTRSFVQKISSGLSIPIMGLTDYNPSGVNILLTYTYGSYTTGIASYRSPLHGSYWLGLHSEQIAVFGVPSHYKQPLNVYDKRFIENLKNDSFIKGNDQILKEIQIMESNEFKIELQNIFNQTNIQEVFQYFAKLILTKKVITIMGY